MMQHICNEVNIVYHTCYADGNGLSHPKVMGNSVLHV